MERLFILFQHLLPQHLLSRCTAWLAGLQSPVWLKNRVLGQYVKIFDVDMAEALEPDYRRYANFNDFFTRALAPGTRPLAGRGVLSPADGRLSQIGGIDHGRLLQAKGRSFSVAELLACEGPRAAQFDGGQFATIYLSPRDYHRVHMPLAGRLAATTYVPGSLFSVNAVTTAHVERLFARNERLVCYFDTAAGPMAMVLVGAMVVAGIETVWAGRMAPPPREPVGVDYTALPPAVELARGEEMGRFLLGSTVILLLPPGSVTWRESCEAGAPVRMGQCLGELPGAEE